MFFVAVAVVVVVVIVVWRNFAFVSRAHGDEMARCSPMLFFFMLLLHTADAAYAPATQSHNAAAAALHNLSSHT